MKSKRSKYALVALFLALLYVPTLIGLVAGDRVKTANLENRLLSERPVFSLDSIDTFPKAYEAYYADNQPFRDPLIYVRALINKMLYNQDISQMVVFGKEDWLFYSNIADGAPIRNYRGEGLFSSAELRQFAMNLVRTRNDLEKIGCDFVLFIVPNKERVYSEYMPDRFGAPAENYPVRQLVDYLRKRTDIKVIYAYDDLMQAKQALSGTPIYYPTDTHWNFVGGYIGTRTLMRELGVELPAVTPDMVLGEGKGVNDLAALSHLTPLYDPGPEYTLDYDTADAAPEDSEKKRICFRHDSFGGYMTAYMRPLFAEGSLLDFVARGDEQVDEAHPDVFVMEVVERYLTQNLFYEPLYAAPENRQASAETAE